MSRALEHALKRLNGGIELVDKCISVMRGEERGGEDNAPPTISEKMAATKLLSDLVGLIPDRRYGAKRLEEREDAMADPEYRKLVELASGFLSKKGGEDGDGGGE